MSKLDAKTLAPVSVAVAASLAIIGTWSKGQTAPGRIFIGAVVSGIILGVTAEIAPELSAAFSVLLLVSSLFVYGGDGLAAIIRAVGPPPGSDPRVRVTDAGK